MDKDFKEMSMSINAYKKLKKTKWIYCAPLNSKEGCILRDITNFAGKNDIKVFKIGFVGNGEPLLDYENLKEYILYIAEYLEFDTVGLG